MMELLLPLGLLGLLGILALIIIYLIKPNYQTKYVTSTHVWKLSLKYKKRKLPTSTVRNILLFICQLLILTAIGLILAKPAIVYSEEGVDNELIAVIDSSTSMYTEIDGETRFDRAVDRAIQASNRALDAGGRVSVIIADEKPTYLRQRVTPASRTDLIAALQDLQNDDYACSFGTSDMDAAMQLSEEVLAENPTAKVEIYTDKSYQYAPENISIVSVREEGEWNVAILDAQTTLSDGYYELTVQLASYGSDLNVELHVEIDGANAVDAETGGGAIELSRSVFCDSDKTKTIIFRYGGGDETDDIKYYDLGLDQRFYTYRSIQIYVNENDNLALDNTFWVYGGLKEVVKVQYSSGDMSIVGANPFVNGALAVLVNALSDRWDIKITEVTQGQEPALEGFDVYIFEHTMPQELPIDGAVLLFDPLTAPIGSDITLRRPIPITLSSPGQFLVAETQDHPLMRNISASKIQVSSYMAIDHSNDYDVLMSCNGSPVVLARNDKNVKTAIVAFSVHNSNLVLLPEWFVLMYNLFDYFLPSTVEGNSFEVNEKITVNARGESVYFSGYEDPIEEFPATLVLSAPGKYTFDVTTYFGKRAQTESIFVRTPKIGSNIYLELESLANPYAEKEATLTYDDLLVYFAAALVALLFIEWGLHSREKI